VDRATSRRIEAVSELVWLLLGETSETTPLPMDLSTNQQLAGLRMTRTPSSCSTSPVTSAVSFPSLASIWRASSAPPKVPIIQSAVAEIT
jgi:hypothetical protein